MSGAELGGVRWPLEMTATFAGFCVRLSGAFLFSPEEPDSILTGCAGPTSSITGDYLWASQALRPA
jgi:hypothetical protein